MTESDLISRTTGVARETYDLADRQRLFDWPPERLSGPRAKLPRTLADVLSVNLCRTIMARQLWPTTPRQGPYIAGPLSGVERGGHEVCIDVGWRSPTIRLQIARFRPA